MPECLNLCYLHDMSADPDNLVLHMLREIRAGMAGMRETMATKGELAELAADLKSGMHTLRADVASDLVVIRKEFTEQITGLRRTVVAYHSSVIGHGILISELEARVRRVEQHLDLPSMEKH